MPLPQRAGLFRVKRVERMPAGSIGLRLSDDTDFIRFAPQVRSHDLEVGNAWDGDVLSGTWETGTWQFGSKD